MQCDLLKGNRMDGQEEQQIDPEIDCKMGINLFPTMNRTAADLEI